MQVTITADEYKDCRGYSDVELELPTDRFRAALAVTGVRASTALVRTSINNFVFFIIFLHLPLLPVFPGNQSQSVQ